jgi:uncharacterized protein YfaS (alpha-2-macroglobulin family)
MTKYLFPLFFLLFFACGQKERETDKNILATELAGQKITLADFVSAKPAAILSSRSLPEIEFKQNMVLQSAVGENLAVNPVDFEPAIKAKAKWLSTSLLQITPDEPLQSGQSYKAKFNGKKAFGKSANTDDYEFEFKIIQNEILEVNGGFEPVAKKVNMAKLILEIKFADKPDSAKLNKELKLNFNSKTMQRKIFFDGNGNFARIESEDVPRTDKNQGAELILPKKWTASSSEFSETFLLPAKGNFVVVGDRDAGTEKNEKVWEMVFSDPIANDMDVSGFVRISPETKYKVSVKNKTLKVKGDFSYGVPYTIKIENGFPSLYGTKMELAYIKQFSFNDEKPQLKWMGSGLFLPLENKGRLQFKSVNVGSAKLEIQEILPQNLVFFLQNNELRSSNRWFSDIERTAKIIYSGDVKFEKAKRNEWLKTEIDISGYFAKKAGAAYIVKLDFNKENVIISCENLCDDYYYWWDNGKTEKILIVSSTALTAKKTSDGIHIWATDVENSKPVSGLLLELYGKVNDILATQRTDANGYVFFKVEQNEGYVVKGNGNRGLALLKLNQNNWETSRFDVGGIYETNKKARLFAYTERGVYRPGDTIHFSGIAREGIEQALANLPMSVSVKNIMGSVVFEGSAKTSEHGLFSLDIPTDLNAPTGEWIALIKSGGNEWQHYLRVETVKPNRLKNTLELPEKLVGSQIKIDAVFNSKYLFGTPAAGLKTEMEISLKNKPLKFLRYPDFTFKNQMQNFSEQESETLFKGDLNSDGSVKLSKIINLKDKNIPEAATITIHATVNENGGGYTESWHSSVIYPYPVFVGLKARSSWEGVRTGDTLRIPVIALDENEKPVAGRKLSVKVYQNRRYSWWESDSYERWDFRKQKQTYIVHEEIMQSGTRAKEFKWVPENDGQIFVEVEDVEGGHSATQFIYASYWSDSENMRNVPEASHLNLTSKQSSYDIGDSILISFEAPAKGNALVSLEYANKVLESKLVEAREGKNVVSFIASKNMLPNVYAVVSLFLPLKSVEGEKPIRYYGVLPIKIENEKTKLDLSMNVPKEIQSGEEFSIEVANNSKENASFTLAVVDEGLLDLTNFKTPDPWKFYFQKLALGIRTSDNFDEIIGILMPDMDSYLSVGGDEEIESRSGKQRTQRFKAVSLFSEVQKVNGGKSTKIKFKMPQYVGSVRAQLIAVSQNAFAKREANIVVKKPLMILPTAPRAAKPGDKFKIPVSVFAMESDVKKVNVHLQVSPNLKIIGKNDFALSFEKTGELDGSFEVETLPTLGSAKIIIKAEDGKHKISDTIDLPIISSSAIYTEVLQSQISAGDSWKTKINAFGIENTHKATLVLNTMPSLRINERLDYLINYPYGCLEQTVSSVFPQLYIDDKSASGNINAGIKRLAQFSMSKGFSYWPNRSDSYADSWSTSYAGHFMLEAKNAGYSISQNLLSTWKSWEIEQSKKEHNNDFRNQAYRLFLLAMAGEEQMGAMNLMKENYLEKLDWLSKYLLAGAYHIAGKEAAAKQILEYNGNILGNYRENSITYGSRLRDQALAALVLAKMGRFKESLDIYQNLAKEWNSQKWWSTQESAFALLAFSALKNKFGSSDIEAEWNANGVAKKVLVKANEPAQIDLTSFGSAEISITALNGTLFAELQTKGLPLEDNIKTENKGLAMQRAIFNQSGEKIYASQIKQGEVFWLVFAVKSSAPVDIENLALSSILPSGFEISNERLNEYNSPGWLNSMRLATPDYMDIRDDRVNWFFGLRAFGTKVFAVQIHPSYAGEFRWPGAILEAMYNPDYFARIAGENIAP